MTIHSQLAEAHKNNIGSIHPEHVNSAETMTALELQELLEHFTNKLNTNASPYRPEPATHVRPDGVMPFAAQVVPPARPEPEHHQGVSTNVTATIISLAMAAGVGWLMYTNPGLF